MRLQDCRLQSIIRFMMKSNRFGNMCGSVMDLARCSNRTLGYVSELSTDLRKKVIHGLRNIQRHAGGHIIR